MTERNGVRLP